jgi:hypothetical protein
MEIELAGVALGTRRQGEQELVRDRDRELTLAAVAVVEAGAVRPLLALPS